MRTSLIVLLALAGCSSSSSTQDASSGWFDLAGPGADMGAACALTMPATVGYQLSYEVDDGSGTLSSRVDTQAESGGFFGRMATKWSQVVDNGGGLPSEVTLYRALDEALCTRAEYDDFESTWFNTVPGPARPGQSGTTQIGGSSWSYDWVAAPSTVVPAGTFSGCMKITRTTTDGRKIEQVHCQGVGMVLQVETATPSAVVTTRLKSM